MRSSLFFLVISSRESEFTIEVLMAALVVDVVAAGLLDSDGGLLRSPKYFLAIAAAWAK
jgi:hypothetical protein